MVSSSTRLATVAPRHAAVGNVLPELLAAAADIFRVALNGDDDFEHVPQLRHVRKDFLSRQ